MIATETVESKVQAFQLKGRLFTLTVLQLQDPCPDKFTQQLGNLLEQAPKFFQNAPIVIDLQLLTAESSVDFIALTTGLRAHSLVPVGIRGGSLAQQNAGREAGLAIMVASGQDDTKSITKVTSSDDVDVTSETETCSKIITKPVRSGQQIYARGGDLIVLASVSQGAELLADGNIHVYGPLRGRALAGISGDKNARIFCASLEAELISVAGHYIINESANQQHQQRPHQIYLEGSKLRIAPL